MSEFSIKKATSLGTVAKREQSLITPTKLVSTADDQTPPANTLGHYGISSM